MMIFFNSNDRQSSLILLSVVTELPSLSLCAEKLRFQYTSLGWYPIVLLISEDEEVRKINMAMYTNQRSLDREDIEARISFHESDIDKWSVSLTKIIEDVPQYMCSMGHPGRISRIPENIREIDVRAYEPCLISIGPYHHGKESLKRMEKTKCAVLKSFLEANPELTLAQYLSELTRIEQRARNFYSDVPMGSQEFVLMLLLDSIFVLSIFCRMPENHENIEKYDGTNQTDKETMTGKQEEITFIIDETEEVESRYVETPRILSGPFMHDLFLLENQLPFFVLEKIYTIAYNGSRIQLINTMKNVFANMFMDYSKSDPESVLSSTVEVQHLLQICHNFFRPSLQQESSACELPDSGEMFRLGSAVQLYEGGVNFVARNGSTRHNLLDITFSSSGEMVMPCLFVDDNTNSLLRNLIALEQMKYPTLGLNVSAYAVLLLHLVTCPKDAQLLRRMGIIQHHLASDKEMVYLVNKITVGLSFDYAEDNYSLKPVFQELKRYSERRAPRWRAGLKHRYFNNPWTTIALVAASILLLLSIVQTFFTVYAYYVPCKGCQL